MNEDDQKNDNIDMADFLKSNSELFVILGVFSALAIYISDLGGGGSVGDAASQIRIGFGGALLLTILLILLIYRQLVNQIGSIGDLFKAHTEVQNWDLVVFTGGVILLLPSLVTPIFQQLLALYYIMGILIILSLIAVVFRIMLRVKQVLPEDEIQRDVFLIIISGICYIGTDEYTEYLRSNPELIGPGPFSTSNLSPVIYDSSAVIALAIGSGSILLAMYAVFDLADTLGDRYRQLRNN
ncbi:hypothetical protein [Halorubrum salipaludis]|uniref:hypothetical protein n=1 Tax=Halorubrum salipaludis TaxID=2032630 RepID=UPI00118195F8|nr:hypothetical protein [Halorubrum salipaludis]